MLNVMSNKVLNNKVLSNKTNISKTTNITNTSLKLDAPIAVQPHIPFDGFTTVLGKLKQMFKDATKMDTFWGVYDEASGEFVGMVDFE